MLLGDLNSQHSQPHVVFPFIMKTLKFCGQGILDFISPYDINQLGHIYILGPILQ